MPISIDVIAMYFDHLASLTAESLSPVRQLCFAKMARITDAKPWCVRVCCVDTAARVSAVSTLCTST
jgi:hypothetical protein